MNVRFVMDFCEEVLVAQDSSEFDIGNLSWKKTNFALLSDCLAKLEWMHEEDQNQKFWTNQRRVG
jgi:hypothetical protein